MDNGGNDFMSSGAGGSRSGGRPTPPPLTQNTPVIADTKQNLPGVINPLWAQSDPRAAQARLVREQYNEWTNTFQPAQGDLLAMTTYDGNKGLAGDMIQRQGLQIDDNFATAEGQQNRSLSRMGMEMTAEQRDGFSADMALNKSLAQVNNVNQTNRWQDDLNKAVLSSGVTGANGMKAA